MCGHVWSPYHFVTNCYEKCQIFVKLLLSFITELLQKYTKLNNVTKMTAHDRTMTAHEI